MYNNKKCYAKTATANAASRPLVLTLIKNKPFFIPCNNIVDEMMIWLKQKT